MKFFAVVLLALGANCQVQLSEFQPYGPAAADTNLASVIPNHADLDDGSSPELQLTAPFKFFDETYRSLWVNINGAVSFKTQIPTYTPECQPLGSNMAMISPFWADVDLRSDTGAVYYRQTTNKTVLDKTKADIVKAFPNNHYDALALNWAFVATWLEVPFYDAVTACHHANLSNTFQLALTTDGTHSFAIFYYNKIQWTTGTASQAVGCTGRGGHSARAGFDNGHGKFAKVDGSCSDDILNVVARSNEGVPGKFVYQVDGGDIIGPGGSTLPVVTGAETDKPTGTVTVTPEVSTHDQRFIDRLIDVRDDINYTYTEVLALCPGLIEHPSLQQECFKLWIELDNRIIETNKANTLDELRLVEKDLDAIADKLDDIKHDIGTATNAPPFVCSSDDARTKRRCEEVQKYLDDVYKLAGNTCPGLIDYPSVQQDCFNQWMLVDDHLAEIRKTTKIDAFDLIYDALTDIEKRLEKIRSDLGIH